MPVQAGRLFYRTVSVVTICTGDHACVTSQGNARKVTDDVAALKPTLFIAVPRVLERIQAGIDTKVCP